MTDVPAAYRDAPRWPFGDSPELADELLALVLAGGKRATCSSLASCATCWRASRRSCCGAS